MLKTVVFALVAGVMLGIGGSLPFGNLNFDGLVTGLIAITCIAIPISLIILLDKKRVAKF